jgi:ABC-2 type transport system permease protein
MFPVASMLVSLYHVGPQLVILLIACLFYGWMPDPGGLLAVLLALLIIMLLGTALALLFSAANVFFRDFGNIVNVFNHFVRYGVTMMFPWSYVQERLGEHAGLFLLNPLADAVLLFQRAFWVGTATESESDSVLMPDHLMLYGFAVLGASLVFLVIGQLVFRRLENKIPERL